MDTYSSQATPLRMSPERHEHSHIHLAPTLPEHRGGLAAPMPCSIPEKCGSLWAQTHPSAVSSKLIMGSFPVALVRYCTSEI